MKHELGLVASRARGSQITPPLAVGGFTAAEIRLLKDQHLGRTHVNRWRKCVVGSKLKKMETVIRRS